MKKKILLGAVALVTLIIIIIAIVAHAPKVNCNDPGFAPYVSAYTDGTVSKKQTIKVVLNSQLAESIDRNANPDKLIRAYPKVAGKCAFVDDRTIEFTPDDAFTSGKDYVFALNLGKIADVPGDYKKFVFPVSIIRQDMKVTIDEQVTTDRQTLKHQMIAGTVKTADEESLENIKKSVKATIGGKELPINWRDAETGTVFGFTIDDIERVDKAQQLNISYVGKYIGSDSKGEKVATIPALNEFGVTSVKVFEAPSQHIRIDFTDPVKENQNLNGLVSVAAGNNEVKNCKIEVSGNTINVFPPERQDGEGKLFLSTGIQNVLGVKIAEDKEYNISFELLKPQVRSVKTGLILPDGDDGLVYPFEAVNLTAVDVTVIKVLEKNILSYIRDYSDYYNGSNLQQTGIPVFRKTIHIADAESEEVTAWNRYYLELSKLVETEPGSIYNIKIAFRKSHAVFDCDTCNGGDDISMEKDIDIKDFDSYDGYFASIDNGYYSSAGYNWRNEDNPCYKMYYQSDKFLSQNILASNLGMIAKKGNDRSLQIFVTDLKSSAPVGGATVELYGYQQQLIATGKTDSDGKYDFGKQPKAYFAIAKRNTECNYLKLNDGQSLSMSKFDISGNEVRDGIKGYMYGERGVWRPGDSIHLTFILKEDLKNPLPADYPISIDVRNPQSQQVYSTTVPKTRNNFYVFNFKTDDNAIAGTYDATVTCGNSRFYKQLRVENILPNRLKINMDFNKDVLTNSGNNCMIAGKWLHGATAKGLKVDVQMRLREVPLTFPKWEGYSFDDDKKSYYLDNNYEEVYDGVLNDKGETRFAPKFSEDLPPKVKAYYMTRIFEKGGRFSKDETSIEVLPHSVYVGIKMPDTDGHCLEVGKEQMVQFAVADANGNALSGRRDLSIKLYKLEWQWWYDSNNYVSQYNSTILDTDTIHADNGKGLYKFRVEYPNWGRYMVDVTDMKSGRSASQIFYMDWPSSYGRSPMLSQGSTIVELDSDKKKYNVGDMATVTIPSSGDGHALVTLETGTKVINSQWISTKEGKTEFKFKVEADMEPGVYVFVELLQPHAQTANDLPLRMYGVLPLDIENPETKLQPEISMPDVLQAEQEVKITVSEKNNKPMTYTLALVDDGILDLTHFATPDPWKQFYSREALGVSTIDMYDNVIGAFGSKIERMFSIGGDDAEGGNKSSRANNFESVVAFLGPFTTNGGKMTHSIKLPKYIGSVRTMVVAGDGKAYGKAEKTTAVTKPLMIFATSPRVIGTCEKFKLPITVFTGEDNIKNVSVKVKASNGLKINGQAEQTLYFDRKGEQNPTFEIETGDDAGLGKIEITATSGAHLSQMELRLQIREPNTPAQQVISRAVDPGATVEIDLKPIGRKNTNTAVLNVSGILPVNFEGHIANILSYPYESLQHTVCKAFPLLYAPMITEETAQQKEINENIVRDAIKSIYAYQTTGGGLSYWRNATYSDVWYTSFAGQFMVEAKKAGYSINPDFLNKWKKYQRTKAEAWTPDSKSSYDIQAYRLYTLALAGDALNAQMNRLKEQTQLTDEAKIYLAAAYAISGNKKTAEALMNPLNKTYNSASPRKLIALVALDQKDNAFMSAKAISERISDDYWIGSEYECLSLVALGKYFDKYKPASKIDCKYEFNGESKTVKTDKIFSANTLQITSTEPQKLTFTNNTNGTLYAEITNSGIPEPGNEKAENSVISAELQFYQNGKVISPKNLKQGTDFMAVITVKNNGDSYIDRLAITEMFPSGWEIVTGLDGGSGFDDDDDDYYYTPGGYIKYTDVRDDRKFTYFSLSSHRSIEFRTQLTATYAGTFYLPGLDVRDLENARIFARTKGMMVEVSEDKE
ncbi:MAG: hypothetical protein IKQ30_07400 [Bacteroidales bacterium]|nr:hypothetical protein [Bacteroidales bacterium]